MINCPKVGLFVTCLVDICRPQIGFACIKLLERPRSIRAFETNLLRASCL